MQLNTITSTRLHGTVRNLAPWITFFFASISILYIYRRGGVVDSIYGADNVPGMRDLGIYIRGGHILIAGGDPYIGNDLAFRSGSFGTLLFGLFPVNQIGFLIGGALNLIGFCYFGITMIGNHIDINIKVVSISIMFVFSCLREVFSTGQITGILAGLAALGFRFLISSNTRGRFFAAFCFAVLIDLKPNLFIVFFLAALIFQRKMRDCWIAPTFLILGHLILDIRARKYLEVSWLNSLSQISDSKLNPTSTGTRTIWPVMRKLFRVEAIPNTIPTFVFLLFSFTFLVYMVRKPSFELLTLSLVIPTTYSYFHLYSLFPAVLLCVFIAILNKNPILLGLTFPILVFSGSSFSILQLFIVILTSFVFIVPFRLYKRGIINTNFLFKFLCLSILVSITRWVICLIFAPTSFWEIVQINYLVVVLTIICLKNGRLSSMEVSE